MAQKKTEQDPPGAPGILSSQIVATIDPPMIGAKIGIFDRKCNYRMFLELMLNF